MSIRILRAALDTLEVTFDGSIDYFKREPLDLLKAEAQERNEGVRYVLADKDFSMQSKGRGVWAYVLGSRDFDLRVSRTFAEKTPGASVRLDAYGLATTDAQDLLSRARRCLGQLGDFTEHGISRVDFAVDFQGWVPVYEEMRHVVSASRYRPVYPSVEHPESFYFGKRPMQLRIYDKTRQIVVKNLPFWLAVWDESEDYVVSGPVWRAESEVCRKVLVELGVRTTADLFRVGPEAVFRYVMERNELRVPGADPTTTRWPVDSRWEELRSAVYRGESLPRARHVSRLLAAEKLGGRVLGLAATLGAHENVRDFDEAMRRLARLAMVKMEYEGLDFDEEVDKRLLRLGY